MVARFSLTVARGAFALLPLLLLPLLLHLLALLLSVACYRYCCCCLFFTSQFYKTGQFSLFYLKHRYLVSLHYLFCYSNFTRHTTVSCRLLKAVPVLLATNSSALTLTLIINCSDAVRRRPCHCCCYPCTSPLIYIIFYHYLLLTVYQILITNPQSYLQTFK